MVSGVEEKLSCHTFFRASERSTLVVLVLLLFSGFEIPLLIRLALLKKRMKDSKKFGGKKIVVEKKKLCFSQALEL